MAAPRTVNVAFTPTKRGWRIRVDSSDGDAVTEAEVAARVLALVAQVAVDEGARQQERDRIAAAVEALADWGAVDLHAVLAIIRGDA